MGGDIEADVLCEAETDSRTDTDGLVEMLVEAESELLLYSFGMKYKNKMDLVMRLRYTFKGNYLLNPPKMKLYLYKYN